MAAAFKLRTFLGGALERYRAGGDASSVLLAASQRERAAVGVGRAFLDACAYVLQSEKGLFPSVPLNERFAFLLWLTEILLPASHRWQMGVLQAAARAAAQSGHGWFALQLARMELRLAREHRSAVEDRAMLYVRLAFAADSAGRTIAALRLLHCARRVLENGGSDPLGGELIYSLIGVCEALNCRIVRAITSFTQAENCAGLRPDADPLQVHVAWIESLCRAAMLPTRTRPTLTIVMSGVDHLLAEAKEPKSKAMDLDMLIFGLERTSYAYLGIFSCALANRLIEISDENLDLESRAIIKLNYANTWLAATHVLSDYNKVARIQFESVVSMLSVDGAMPEDRELSYQLAHAYAGIGFTYSNEARDTQGGERRSLFDHATTFLNKATGIFKDLGLNRPHEARAWSAAGTVASYTGSAGAVHRNFAVALTSGRTKDVERIVDLEDFFVPDSHVRLTYSEALVRIGEEQSAILFAKGAVRAVHHSSLPETGEDLASTYVHSRGATHRYLVSLLVGNGRFNEAEQAFELLKLDQYERFMRSVASAEEVAENVAVTSFEQDAIETSGLQAVINAATPRSSISKAAIETVAGALARLDGDIRGGLQSSLKKPIDEHRYETHAQRNEDRSDCAMLQYVVANNRLSILVSVGGEQISRTVNVDQKDLLQVAFNLRQACRTPSDAMDNVMLSASKSLYQILFTPIESLIPDAVSTIFIEVDDVLGIIPFALLHDGQCYLIERFAIVNLNRGARPSQVQALDTDAQGSNHVALFAVSHLPGEELPGASAEIAIVHDTLLDSTHDVECAGYLDDESTIDAFLREVSRPRNGQGALHIATHARFNATSEERSVLSLADGDLTLGRLKDEIRARGCDTAFLALSACGTARRDLDVDGFTTTLLRAGVKVVLSSMWETIDESAVALFGLFYKSIDNFASSKSVARALQKAQLELLSVHESGGAVRFSHPANWAPYVVSTSRIN